MSFSDEARWIWIDGEPSPHNFWLRVRRAFSCPTHLKRATLWITADSRYELFVNGHDLGNGPIRSFAWSYSYDEYDITSWLKTGETNVIAARVVHWGAQTFQYIRQRAGFLCEVVLETIDGQQQRIVSNEEWRVSPDPTIQRRTPRISLQQGFEEQIDARQDENWYVAAYQDHNWSTASVIGPVGVKPWTHLTPRSIPFLSRDVVNPEQVLAVELARLAPGYFWCFDPEHQAKDPTVGIRGEKLGEIGRAFATEIIAPHDCTIILHQNNGPEYEPWKISCNGIHVKPGKLDLQAGRNLFVITDSQWPSFYFQTNEVLRFDASRILAHLSPDQTQVPVDNQQDTWLHLRNYDERYETPQQIHDAKEPSQLPQVPFTLLLTKDDNMEDIYLYTQAAEFLLPPQGFCDPAIDIPQPRTHISGSEKALVSNTAALLHQNTNATLVYPQKEGDTHLIIDFGRELFGFPVLEVDAPEGTILDVNCFEGIDEGGIFWTDGLRNSFRYICHQGLQTFRSHQKRGFRYLALTVRHVAQSEQAVKLYNVHCLQNTYPVEQQGHFSSSDARLNKIWEVAAYTVQLCMDDTYIDCPAYEQVFWVGDARNSALVNAVAFGAFDFTDRCIRLVAESLSSELDGIKPPHKKLRPHLTTDHVVSGWFDEIPMWTFLWIWNVWEHYYLTGDIKALGDLYPAVSDCLARCLSMLTPRGLLNIPAVWNLLDWAATDLTEDGEVTANNVLLVESLRRAAQMAEILAAIGQEESAIDRLRSEAQGFLSAAEKIKQAVNKYCWSEEHGAYVDTVRDEEGYSYHVAIAEKHGTKLDKREQFLARTRFSEVTNTLVLLCNCATPERAQQIFPLVQAASNGQFIGTSPGSAPKWPADKAVPVGSPWFLFFTLEALFAQQEHDLALAIIRDQWGRMLDKGATTFWETFPNLNAKHWSRSLCHGWSAAPAYFLSTYVLGIQPVEPGYAQVCIAPQPGTLTLAQGSVPTVKGLMTVKWQRDSDAWKVEVTVPEGVTGVFVLPESTEEPQYISGTRTTTTRAEDNTWQLTLPSGGTIHYHAAR